MACELHDCVPCIIGRQLGERLRRAKWARIPEISEVTLWVAERSKAVVATVVYSSRTIVLDPCCTS